MSTRKEFRAYARVMIALSAAVILYSIVRFPLATLDVRFLALCAITLGITSRISIALPRFKSEISVSDTFIFLTMLLYGGEAAVLLATVECFLSSLRFCKQKLTVAFNVAAMAVATFITACALRLCFPGGIDLMAGFTPNLISALCLIACVQYVANSGLVGLGGSLKSGQPFWPTWNEHYLWTSITYVAGASTAGIIGVLIGYVGSFAIAAATPIIIIVYLTYRTYLKNVEVSITQAEQAERHVAELSHYIAEQERIREQFTQIEKLSALGELASGVAHDFNNTLAGILGRAQLLLRTDDPEKIKRGLQIIIKTAEDGAKTVKRIQDFARQRRAYDFEPVEVAQLLLDASEITRPRWKDRAEASGVHISLELEVGSKASVLGNDSELREVLVNMVFNAVDAMPQGGKLRLRAEELEDEDKVQLIISDTGAGMTPEVRSRIFDPFFTTKGKAGLGLGLAVSYGIIRRHEGTIEVESEVGKGTTFRITLPASTGSLTARQETELNVSAPAADLNGKRFLVVDDEPSVRELLRDILESEGYETVLASSGSEALALFREASYDAVFTDIGMPGMSGWELAQAIRELNSAVPLAVITGWGEAVASEEQKAAQVDWVVTKPFSTDRITELAHEATRRGETENAALTFAA